MMILKGTKHFISAETYQLPEEILNLHPNRHNQRSHVSNS